VREVFGTGEEAKEGTALLGEMVANGAAEHGVGGFESVQRRAEGDGRLDVEFDFAVDFGEIAEMRRKDDANHGCLISKVTENEVKGYRFAVKSSKAAGGKYPRDDSDESPGF
jgi:hypothetical protein